MLKFHIEPLPHYILIIPIHGRYRLGYFPDNHKLVVVGEYTVTPSILKLEYANM